MEQAPHEPLVGMLGCDREVFARVWARVAPAAGEGCPIAVLPPQAPVSAPPALTPPHRPGVDVTGTDEPTPAEVPCLGAAGTDHNGLLGSFIRDELSDWRTYQSLSRRANGSAARALASIAADEYRHAKRLSAAHFLLSGVRFFPEPTGGSPPKTSFWGALRERFWAEQHGAWSYWAAAEETSDPCLAALYRELAEEETAHADLLRALVEKM